MFRFISIITLLIGLIQPAHSVEAFNIKVKSGPLRYGFNNGSCPLVAFFDQSGDLRCGIVSKDNGPYCVFYQLWSANPGTQYTASITGKDGVALVMEIKSEMGNNIRLYCHAWDSGGSLENPDQLRNVLSKHFEVEGL